ncbi:MAG: XdhC family protein [Deltaproteobacteria bacterium]|jgi:xanthine dehydrogenase accessory factor|nr:XdhC family protein [Deltaproteobacteria bacterium]MBT4267846.1 XdhC family protein [Deltaproteobacteria bacterium]MBT4638247.1 XdhC family protein [Deltaproteobacteria bacterium]MBT6499175.1 XdhC family protein [Deltaproteobacteria bacterium]MBT6612123.1 XdhC family protein [Deltaproteobacteria bacterium]
MDIISRINDLLESVTDFCLATVILSSDEKLPSGSKIIILSDGSLENGSGIKDLDDLIASFGQQVLDDKKKQIIEIRKGITIFFDLIGRQANLIICGAGHIGVPLAKFAISLGFIVTVIDDRPDFANPSRFKNCTVIANDFIETLQNIKIDKSTYVVLITRGHEHDTDCLAQVLPRETAYVGLIGSRRRIRLVLERLSRQGVSNERLQDVFSPIGLPIGSETPAEIALAIAAELVSIRRLGSEHTRTLRNVVLTQEKIGGR